MSDEQRGLTSESAPPRFGHALSGGQPPLTDAPPPVFDRPATTESPAVVPDRNGTGKHTLSRRERKALGRLRARKVHRIVRHVDPWAVLKLSLLFYLCLFVIVLVAGVLLWNLAASAGTVEDIEGFVRDMGAFETFEFKGGQIFAASALGGLVLVVAGAGLNVLLVVLFNLISDLVGGVRVTVIEEETARPVS